ncbi:hypothetical protein ACFYU9_03940 [Streptomyces sp. NPDC004327]|uniref:hypothetical protein n=1 Tax=Streptomyces sp. NPDC004327 TaxID=3364699 RepID=UPI0036BF12EB
MTALLTLFGVLAASAGLLIAVLLRRRGGSTENAEGLVLERARREQAHRDRMNSSSVNVRSGVPTTDNHHLS